MNYEEYESYNDMYDGEDDAIIEAALDIYDQYEVSMEEAVDMAMESLYSKVLPYTSQKKFGKYKVDSLDIDRKDLSRKTYVRQDGLTDEEISKRLAARAKAFRDFDDNVNRLKKREKLNMGIGAAALGAGGVALYKYKKKKLAEAAKAEKEAEELDSRAARKRAKAQKAVAQAKEAVSFGYDY